MCVRVWVECVFSVGSPAVGIDALTKSLLLVLVERPDERGVPVRDADLEESEVSDCAGLSVLFGCLWVLLVDSTEIEALEVPCSALSAPRKEVGTGLGSCVRPEWPSVVARCPSPQGIASPFGCLACSGGSLSPDDEVIYGDGEGTDRYTDMRRTVKRVVHWEPCRSSPFVNYTAWVYCECMY